MADSERGREREKAAAALRLLVPPASARCGGGAKPGMPRSRGGARGVPAMEMPPCCKDMDGQGGCCAGKPEHGEGGTEPRAGQLQDRAEYMGALHRPSARPGGGPWASKQKGAHNPGDNRPALLPPCCPLPA